MYDDRFSDMDWDAEPIATQRVELRLRLANAKNDMAARMGWYIAFFASFTAHLKWDSWPITLLTIVGAYSLSTYDSKQHVKRARAAYVAHTHHEPDFM